MLYFQITFFFFWLQREDLLSFRFNRGYHLSASYDSDTLLGTLDTINPMMYRLSPHITKDLGLSKFKCIARKAGNW